MRIQLLGGLLLLAAGCRGAPSGPRPSPSAARSAPPASPLDAAAPGVGCSELRTLSIETRADYGALQNLRIAAAEQGAFLTWERLDVPRTGDSTQVGFGALVGKDGDGPVTVALPARGYAAAYYTTVSPSTIQNHLDFVAQGVAGSSDYRTYATGIGAWKGIRVFEDVGPNPRQTATLPFSLVESLVVAPTVPLAALAGVETPCDNRYHCQEVYEAAEQHGFPKSVRTLSFAGKGAHSEILFRGSTKSPSKRFVPAVTAAADRALVSYRVDDQLKAQWVALDGKPLGNALTVGPSGDLGAPAVTMAGGSGYAVWAHRAQASDPYRVWVARLGLGQVEAAVPLDTGQESAFAPALAVHGKSLLVAWMQGDAGQRGTIRLGRLSLDAVASGPAPVPVHPVQTETPDDGNRRDPELAIQGDRIYLTWSDFTAKKSGVPVLRTLDCGAHP